jgi:hypothetical protein
VSKVFAPPVGSLVPSAGTMTLQMGAVFGSGAIGIRSKVLLRLPLFFIEKRKRSLPVFCKESPSMFS